jgi:hypothetical protein
MTLRFLEAVGSIYLVASYGSILSLTYSGMILDLLLPPRGDLYSRLLHLTMSSMLTLIPLVSFRISFIWRSSLGDVLWSDEKARSDSCFSIIYNLSDKAVFSRSLSLSNFVT